MRIALTFDAETADKPGSAPANVLDILGDLDTASVRATFFIQGRWATAYPYLAKAIVDAGHAIGNHTHCHAPSTWLTRDGFMRDTTLAERVIEEVTGKDPRPWFRPAFGDTAPRFDRWLAEMGYYPPVLWNIGSQDWELGITPEQVAENVLSNLCDRYIILMHTWSDAGAAALPEILEADVDFVTLGAIAMADE